MSGIYGILVNNSLVYIGKANDMSERKNQHWVGMYQSKENKYALLRGAMNQHARIQFVVLERCPISCLLDREEIWIKTIRPILNSIHNEGIGKRCTSQEFWDYVDRNKEVERWVEV